MTSRPTRREFIRTASSGLAGLGAASQLITPGDSLAAAAKSTVAVIRNEKAVSDRNECNRKEVDKMVAKGLEIVTGKNTAKAAWESLGVMKDDIVAIKVNCNQAGFPLYVHTDLVYSLCDSLSTVVRPNNIIVYERSSAELTRAGFRENTGDSGVRCFGTEAGGGFHSREGLTKIVTDMATKVINVPSLKAFGSSYVGSLFLKNHIGTVPRSEMSRCHGDTEMITRVNASPSLKNKTILGVCDGLRGNYKRGVPWFWKGIIMSRDVVAGEYAAIQTINEKLAAEKEQTNELPSYVMLAESAYELGTCTPSKIDMVRQTL